MYNDLLVTERSAEQREEPSRYSGNAIQILDDTRGIRWRQTSGDDRTDARRAIVRNKWRQLDDATRRRWSGATREVRNSRGAQATTAPDLNVRHGTSSSSSSSSCSRTVWALSQLTDTPEINALLSSVGVAAPVTVITSVEIGIANDNTAASSPGGRKRAVTMGADCGLYWHPTEEANPKSNLI